MISRQEFCPHPRLTALDRWPRIGRDDRTWTLSTGSNSGRGPNQMACNFVDNISPSCIRKGQRRLAPPYAVYVSPTVPINASIVYKRRFISPQERPIIDAGICSLMPTFERKIRSSPRVSGQTTNHSAVFWMRYPNQNSVGVVTSLWPEPASRKGARFEDVPTAPG